MSEKWFSAFSCSSRWRRVPRPPAAATAVRMAFTVILGAVWRSFDTRRDRWVFTADGAGNITSGKTTASIDGTVTTATFTGSYSIAADCRAGHDHGFEQQHEPLFCSCCPAPNSARDRSHRRDPGATVSGSAHSQVVGVCGLTGKAEAFAEHLTGMRLRLEAVVGKLEYGRQRQYHKRHRGFERRRQDHEPTRVSGDVHGKLGLYRQAQINYRARPRTHKYVTVDGNEQYLVIETGTPTP